MRAYIDADVLIWHLRGEAKARAFLRSVLTSREDEPWIGAMQRAEVVFFLRPNEEKATLALLAQFSMASADQEIVDLGARLFRRWRPTHGIDVNDALLAATVMRTGGKIYCLNVRHFPMPDLIVARAW